MPAIVGGARAARFILPVGIRVPRSLLPSALSRAGGGDGDPTGDAVTRGRPCPGGRGTSPAPRVAAAAALHLERHHRCPAGRVQLPDAVPAPARLARAGHRRRDHRRDLLRPGADARLVVCPADRDAELPETRLSPVFRRRAWQVLAVLGAALLVVMLVLGAHWQAHIHELMGLADPSGWSWAGIVVVAVLVFALFVGIGRGVRWLAHRLIRLLQRIMPRRVARALGVLVVTVLVLFLLNGVLFQGLVNAANEAFSVKDGGTEQGAVRPTAPERSGSPASLVSWDSLGLQGRNFGGLGPTPEELTAFSGRPALEPVRVYAGLATADDVA